MVNLLQDLQDLQERLGLAYLFIAHDLSMVKHISRRVAVMYLGHLVELTDRKTLFADPLHPYTQSLASAVPIPHPNLERQRQRFILTGEPPSPAKPPPGCVFHPRCPLAVERCKVEVPALRAIEAGDLTACHLADRAGGSKIPKSTE